MGPVNTDPRAYNSLLQSVARAQKAGRAVHVWTIDDPDEMRRLLDLHVDGIMTDRVTALREVIHERGQWR